MRLLYVLFKNTVVVESKIYNKIIYTFCVIYVHQLYILHSSMNEINIVINCTL